MSLQAEADAAQGRGPGFLLFAEVPPRARMHGGFAPMPPSRGGGRMEKRKMSVAGGSRCCAGREIGFLLSAEGNDDFLERKKEI